MVSSKDRCNQKKLRYIHYIISLGGIVISLLSPAEVTRYASQMALEGWGREAQEHLKTSQVLIAGAGALAAATAVYLLTGGVGAIRLVDETRVSLADLNHHVLFRERDLGKAKATTAVNRLKERNSFVQLESYVKGVTENNVFRLTSGCNVLIDASNKTGVGALLNLAAAREQVPLIHASMGTTEGVLTTFWPGRGPCLACTSIEPPYHHHTSLLGPLPGIMGSLQALEVLRILSGVGPALLGRLVIFNGGHFTFTEKVITANLQCVVCCNCAS